MDCASISEDRLQRLRTRRNTMDTLSQPLETRPQLHTRSPSGTMYRATSIHLPRPRISTMTEREMQQQRSSQTSPTNIRNHGFYCRFKSNIKTIFQSNIDNKAVEQCKHKFRHGRCKKCDVPETIIKMDHLHSGFYSKVGEYFEYELSTSDGDLESYVSEDSSVVIHDSMTESAKRTPKNGKTLRNLFKSTERNSITSTRYSTEYSSRNFPIHKINTSPPPYYPPTGLIHEDETPTPESTISSHELENATSTSATAIRITTVVPTTVQIRHSILGQQQQQQQQQAPTIRRVPTSKSTLRQDAAPVSLNDTLSIQAQSATNAAPLASEKHNLSALLHSAISGDIEAQITIMKLYHSLLTSAPCSGSSNWNTAERNLIRKARALVGLQIQLIAGRVADEVFEVVRTRIMGDMGWKQQDGGLAGYIWGLAEEGGMSEARARQILGVVGEEKEEGSV